MARTGTGADKGSALVPENSLRCSLLKAPGRPTAGGAVLAARLKAEYCGSIEDCEPCSAPWMDTQRAR